MNNDNEPLELTTVRDLLEIDPESLTKPLPWELILRPFWFYHASDHEVWMERKKRGWDEHKGIPGDSADRAQAWATACYVTTRAGDIATEKFRLKAVQIALRDHCGAWHAAAQAAGKPDSCMCAKCQPVH